MTLWAPHLPSSGMDHYWAIVEALARDIGTGVLKPGQRLPTHRELAEQLGLAVGTITKAYAEAKRLGYIRSSVGSGTFVREHPLRERRRLMTDREDVERTDLSFNKPILSNRHVDAFRKALEIQARSELASSLLPYHRPWIGFERHRVVASEWMRRMGLEASPGDIAVVSGAQHGLAVALLTAARAGDIVVTEELIDPSTRLLLGGLGLSVHGVEMDQEGILPDAFANICRSENVRALVCVPDHHSPTLTVWSAERRRQIAEIARSCGVIIVENAVYRPFLEAPPPPLATFAPELSYFCTSFSKIAAPGLRVGFLVAPPGRVDELVLGLGTTLWMAAPLMVEIVAQWIASDSMEELIAWQRSELAARNAIAADIFKGADFSALPSGMHIWLRLPDKWRSSALEREARASGVLLSASEVFAIGPAPDAVRISLGGGAESREQLIASLGTIKAILNRKVGSILDF
jgi:DNA-binding transcriptional MocR family regulator